MRLVNCLVPNPDGRPVLSELDIVVDAEGRISRLCPPSHPLEQDDRPIFDCKGGVVSPGFIDLQLNGGFGVDFSDPSITLEGVLSVLQKLPEFGVTSICATLISSAPEQYAQVVPILRDIHRAGAPADCGECL